MELKPTYSDEEAELAAWCREFPYKAARYILILEEAHDEN